MYNASAYIRECIDSVLCQTFTDFELLIVDDGSTDESRDIVRSYDDPRIRLIENKHDYTGSFNLLLDEAKGVYIARLDNDDIMMPDRLEFQYTYMEEHPEIDILGGSMISFGESEGICTSNGPITLNDLLKGNYLSNPTTMMRRESIKKAKLRYDERFKYAEDYRFWAQAAMAGLRLMNLDKIVIKYRTSSGQISSIHSYEQYKKAKEVQKEISQWLGRDEAHWAETHPIKIPDTHNKLTVIIPFLNEKEEVRNTVRSIRETAGERVDIIVINDQSNDGYNYREDVLPLHVTYIYNKERKGVAASRDYGVSLCKTPYFLLLDAHMRFYDTQWVDRIVSMLEQDDRCLLCCQTGFLSKNQNGEIIENSDNQKAFGAYVTFNKNNYVPGISWNYVEKKANEQTEEIAAVLGAGYAASTRYWKYLRGLEGLHYYGSDETFISLKVWLEGGRCLLLKDIVIGHLYREESPYKRYNEEEVYNGLLISYLLFPQNLDCMANAVALLKDSYTYTLAKEMLMQNQEELEEARNYYKQIFTIPIDSVMRLQMNALPYDAILLATYKNRMADFHQYVCWHIPEKYGLFEGKTAALIWMCHYAEYTNDNSCLGIAVELWDTIKQAIRNEELSWNFCNGTSGIGWAILYLYSRGFITEKPDKLLSIIDKSIKVLDLSGFEDLSTATGLGGIFAYLGFRMQYNDTFTEEYKTKLQQIALHLIQNSRELSACYYAMLFISSCNTTEVYKINKTNASLNDWLTCPFFLPADPCYWDTSLAKGCIGTMIQIMCFEAERSQYTLSN